MFTPYTRHTSPASRAAIRDAIAADMAREPRVIPVPTLEPHVRVAWTVTMAFLACGWVEALPL